MISHLVFGDWFTAHGVGCLHSPGKELAAEIVVAGQDANMGLGVGVLNRFCDILGLRVELVRPFGRRQRVRSCMYLRQSLGLQFIETDRTVTTASIRGDSKPRCVC